MRIKERAGLLFPVLATAVFLLFHSCDMIDPPIGRINPNDPYCPVATISNFDFYTDGANFDFSYAVEFKSFDDSWSKDDIPEALMIVVNKNSGVDRPGDGGYVFGFFADELNYGGSATANISEGFSGFDIRDFDSGDPSGFYFLNVFWTDSYDGSVDELHNGSSGDNTEWLGPVSAWMEVRADYRYDWSGPY